MDEAKRLDGRALGEQLAKYPLLFSKAASTITFGRGKSRDDGRYYGLDFKRSAHNLGRGKFLS